MLLRTAVFTGIALAMTAPARAQFARLLKDIVPGRVSSSPKYFTELPTTTVFIAGLDVWRTDGTEKGTVLLKRIPKVRNVWGPTEVVRLGNKAYIMFGSFDWSGPSDLWETDGTVAGTRRTVLMPTLGWAAGAVVAGNKIVFEGRDATTTAFSMWAIDPTVASPKPVNLRPFKIGSRTDTRLIPIGNEVLFALNDDKVGFEIWRSDGTPARTRLVKDVHPGPASGLIDMRGPFGDRVYFAGDDGITGPELWETDGTAAGTKLFRDLVANGGSSPRVIGSNGDLLYVVTGRTTTTLFAVHRTTGKADKIWTNASVAGMTVLGHRVLFLLQRQLHVTDTITKKTVRLTTTVFSLAVRRTYASIGSRFVLVFGDAERTWITDGTAAGTRTLDTSGAALSDSTVCHGKVYFLGRDARHGYEPWVSDLGLAVSTRSGTGLGVDTRIPSLFATDPILGLGTLVTLDGGVARAPTLLGLSAGRSPAFEFSAEAWARLNPATLIALVLVPTQVRSDIPLAIPNDARLKGEWLTLQAFLFGTGPKRGFELSNAVHASVGH